MNLGSFLHDTLKITEKRVGLFLEDVCGKYLSKNPYHNWLHAVDVCHCVYQMMLMTKSRSFMSASERFTMLISACCHDISHPGVNNPFLVESNDPLSLKYNDKSPLENLHCAVMFETAFSNPATALYRDCEKSLYMEQRRLAIMVILHTDMVHHFPMVRHPPHGHGASLSNGKGGKRTLAQRTMIDEKSLQKSYEVSTISCLTTSISPPSLLCPHFPQVSELKLLQEENYATFRSTHSDYWEHADVGALQGGAGGGKSNWEMPPDVSALLGDAARRRSECEFEPEDSRLK